ncbi:GNAT family N-acetyltransferase [Candidatus Berkiella aquae]|nr:GNAT family N-acetyltransferase [Candidatus Berkiella aquae]
MLSIREPSVQDEAIFLAMTQASRKLHHPWVNAPLTHEDYVQYLVRQALPNQKNFLVFGMNHELVGVFNISEIVRGGFQSAYLGFYGALSFQGQGLMSQGLQLVLREIFTTLALHRIEANIQPQNIRSIALVKRCGFRKEGFSERYLQIDNEWRDHERWAITIEDWQNQGR